MVDSVTRDPKLDGDRDRFLAHPVHSLDLPWLFYGSLRAPEVFEIVVGRPMSAVPFEAVTLRGYELARIIAGDGFPGIFPAEEPLELTCLLTDDLTPAEQLRVAWYEWDEYKLGRFDVTDGRAAQAFVPDIDAIHRVHGSIDFHPWSFEDWRSRFLNAAIPNAEAWMAEMPDISSRLIAAE
jgi:hypothetical protein